MRKLLISAALATATIATAVPTAAMAQPGYGWQRGGPTRAQVRDLLNDLRRAEQRINRAPGISRREAVSLRREAAQIRFRLNRALRSNGMSQRASPLFAVQPGGGGVSAAPLKKVSFT